MSTQQQTEPYRKSYDMAVVIFDGIREQFGVGLDINDLPKHAADLMQEVRQLREDQARLDWLEAQGNGQQWIARESTTGRGYRLHNTSRDGSPTAREAIDKAMQEQQP